MLQCDVDINVYVYHQSQIQFEDEDYLYYVSLSQKALLYFLMLTIKFPRNIRFLKLRHNETIKLILQNQQISSFDN